MLWSFLEEYGKEQAPSFFFFFFFYLSSPVQGFVFVFASVGWELREAGLRLLYWVVDRISVKWWVSMATAVAKRLVPLLDRVLVEKVVPPTKSAGGILLPDSMTKVG